MDNSSKKMKQVKALKIGKGVQYLINAAYKILGNPLLMHDVGYKLLAYTENIVTDDPLWNEIITIGYHSSEMIEFFKNEYFLDAVANTNTITFLTSDKLKYDRILGKVFNRDKITVANVNVVACNKSFEDDDPMIFEAICKKISQELGKIEFYQDYGKTYQETMIRILIDGGINDKRLYSSQVANIYEGLQSNIYLAVVDIAQCDPEYTRLGYFRDLFRQTLPTLKYAIYSNYIIIIISSSGTKLNIKKDLHKLKKIFEENNICAGISSCFDNLFGLRKYYMEALEALDYGLKNNINHRIFLYDETMQN